MMIMDQTDICVCLKMGYTMVSPHIIMLDREHDDNPLEWREDKIFKQGKMMNDPPKKEVRCLKDMGVPPRNEDMWIPAARWICSSIGEVVDPVSRDVCWFEVTGN